MSINGREVPLWLKIGGALVALLLGLGALGMTPWPSKSEVLAIERKQVECCLKGDMIIERLDRIEGKLDEARK